jgi:hypothetical protein
MITAVPAFAGQPLARVRSAVEQAAVSQEDRGALLQEAEQALLAGIPAGDLEVILLRSRERGLPTAMTRELIGIAAQAGRQGAPTRPVLDRIEQGLAKGAPAERVAAASRRLVEKLAAAGPMVDVLAQRGLRSTDPREREYAVESVARALEQSVPERVLSETGVLAGERGRSMAQFDRAVRSLTFFVSAGMPADKASKVIAAAMERNFRERDYARLERDVNDMLRRGKRMNEVADAAEHQIRESRGSREDRMGETHEHEFGRERDSRTRGGSGGHH